MNYLLLEILYLPLISAIVLLLFKSKPVVTIRTIAILFGLVSFGLSCKVVNDYLPKVEKQRDLLQQKQTFVPDDSIRLELIRFSPSNPEFPASGALNFYIGIDGLNVFLIPLASGLFLAAIFAAWNSITVNAGIFYMLLALLHFATLGAFLSFDIIQFYMFFEFTLVPLLFLIALWGGANRLYAARKIFIYTLAGGLFTLLGIITLVSAMHQESIVTNHEKPITFSIPELVTASSQTSEILQKAVPETDGKYLRDWNSVQKWIFLSYDWVCCQSAGGPCEYMATHWLFRGPDKCHADNEWNFSQTWCFWVYQGLFTNSSKRIFRIWGDAFYCLGGNWSIVRGSLCHSPG